MLSGGLPGTFRGYNSNDLPDTYRNGMLSFSGNPGSFFNQNTRSDNDSRNNPINGKKGPKYPQHSITCIRLSTFNTWPLSIGQNIDTMVEAGFYYTGNNDHVRCFYCGIGLQNWDSEDNPFVEHARWSPDCEYLKDKKGINFISTVQDAVRKNQMEEALHTDSGPGIAEEYDFEEDGVSASNDRSTGNEVLPNGQKLSKAEKKNPLLTDAAQTILTMGYLPRVIKIVVDRVLKDKGWVGLNSRNLMEEIYKIEESGEIPKSQMTVPTTSKVKRSVLNIKKGIAAVPEDEVKKIKEEYKEMKEQTQCKICCEEFVSIVFLPCGHITACTQCAPALKSCPVCRTEIKGSVKIQFE